MTVKRAPPDLRPSGTINNDTIRGNADRYEQRILTVNMVESHFIIRSDLITEEMRPLPGARLKTVSVEDTKAAGEVTC